MKFLLETLDFLKKKRNLRLFRKNSEIAGERDDSSRAGSNTIDSRDDRLFQSPHLYDQFAGHSREFEQAFYIAREKLADYFMHIAAGAEAAPITFEQNDFYALIRTQALKQIGKIAINFERERVQCLRPRELYARDALMLGIEKRIGLHNNIFMKKRQQNNLI